MKLRDLASKLLVTVGPSDSIDKAIVLMEEYRIRHLPVVVDDLQLVGIVSHGDLLQSVGGLTSHERHTSNSGPATIGPTRIDQIMTSHLYTLSPDEHCEVGGRLLTREKIAAIPLVANERLVGIVTETDFLRCFISDRFVASGGWRFTKAGAQMWMHIFTLTPEDTVAKAAALMRQKRVHHIPIVTGEKLVGIVSDHDIRRALGRSAVDRESDNPRDVRLNHEMRLADIMTRHPQVASPSATLAEIADRMLTDKIGAMPIVEGEKLLGIVSETDLLHVLVAAMEA